LSKSTPTLQEGTLINYELKMRGIPLRWQSRIEEWKPNERFIDRQLKGPYDFWHHTHAFVPLNGGTLMMDSVRYRLPGGPLGQGVAGRWVARDLEKIFRYRRDTIEKIFR